MTICNNTNHKRLEFLDIAKCLGILLVVIGHTTFSPSETVPYLETLRNIIYQFHVPLFFFISGLLYKENTSWDRFLKNKIKRLYLPYLLFNLFALIIYGIVHQAIDHNVIVTDLVKHYIKVALGLSCTQIAGATWFIIVLFEGLIIYKGLDYLCSKSKKSKALLNAIIIVLFILNSFLSISPDIQRLITALFFIHAGRVSCSSFIKLNSSKPFIRAVIMIICYGIVIIISKLNHPDLSDNRYGNLSLYLISAFAGITATLLFSQMIASTLFSHYLSTLGKSSMSILLWHFIAFKLVTLIQMVVYHQSIETIYAFPCNIITGVWPIVYFFFGITLPLMLSFTNASFKRSVNITI